MSSLSVQRMLFIIDKPIQAKRQNPKLFFVTSFWVLCRLCVSCEMTEYSQWVSPVRNNNEATHLSYLLCSSLSIWGRIVVHRSSFHSDLKNTHCLKTNTNAWELSQRSVEQTAPWHSHHYWPQPFWIEAEDTLFLNKKLPHNCTYYGFYWLQQIICVACGCQSALTCHLPLSRTLRESLRKEPSHPSVGIPASYVKNSTIIFIELTSLSVLTIVH